MSLDCIRSACGKPLLKPQNLAIIATILLIMSCSGYGEKIVFGKWEVYYKNVEFQEAIALGNTLVPLPFYEDETKSIQMSRKDGIMHLRLVVKAPLRGDRATAWTVSAIGYLLKSGLYPEDSVVMHICDNHFSALVDLPVRFIGSGQGNIMFTDSIPVAMAARLGTYLDAAGFSGPGHEYLVQVDKQGETYLFRTVSRPGAERDPEKVEMARIFTSTLSSAVFGNAPVDYHFTDELLRTTRVVFYSGLL